MLDATTGTRVESNNGGSKQGPPAEERPLLSFSGPLLRALNLQPL
jgi:hypothetical protein